MNLYTAFRELTLNNVRSMIDKKVISVDGKYYRYEDTPLHIAVECGRLDLVEFLFSLSPSTINEKNKNGNTPLHVACRNSKYLDIVEFLVNNGARVNEKNKHDITPLHDALSYGRRSKIEIVEYLVGSGADIHAKDKFGNNCLYCACSSDNVEILKYLLNQYSPSDVVNYIREKNDDGETLLHRACYLGNLEVVKFLVENFSRDISIDCQAEKYRKGTPLHVACLEGNTKVVRYLIECGANREIKDEEGVTFLEYLYEDYREDIEEFIINFDLLEIKCPDE